MARPAPQPGIDDIKPYIPGAAPEGTSGRPVYKLASNESALGPSPKAMDAYAEATKSLHLYPDGSARALREAIGALHDLEPDRIVCGAGSDEILQFLTKAYLGPGDSIVMSRHGFSVYHILAQGCGASTIFAEETNLTADVDAMLEAVDETTRLCFIANPNNPTGTVISGDELRRLRAGLREDILLVVDSAYAEYMEWDSYEDGAEMVRESVSSGAENVVMTRTFSKIYGLGGIRLGWAYCPPSIAEVLNKVRGPFNVSLPAIAAGVAAINDQDFVRRNVEHNREERARITQAIRGLGFTVGDSHGNFVLVQGRGDAAVADAAIADAEGLITFLKSRGVTVRQMGGYFLPDHVRISIGSREANDALLAALEDYAAR